MLIQSLCATGASHQAHLQTYQTTLQHRNLAPLVAPLANSQALVSQQQLMTSFDHLNPHSMHHKAQISEVESVESGISAMTLQQTQRFHGFSAQQNDFPNICESVANFSSRQRPSVEHLDLSSLSPNSPSQWNVQSPLKSGESIYGPSVSRQMFFQNEEARDARRVMIESSGNRSLSSPSSALSPDHFQHLTPPTCSKVLLPEFSQEFSSKKLFSGSFLLASGAFDCLILIIRCHQGKLTDGAHCCWFQSSHDISSTFSTTFAPISSSI
jgi:hypothetical protein